MMRPLTQAQIDIAAADLFERIEQMHRDEDGGTCRSAELAIAEVIADAYRTGIEFGHATGYQAGFGAALRNAHEDI
jgi:hypothetical protein